MSVRERILTIRLMEKLQAHPAYAKALGLEVKAAQSSNMTVKNEK